MTAFKIIPSKVSYLFGLFLLCSSIGNVAFSLPGISTDYIEKKPGFSTDYIKKRFDYLNMGFIYSHVNFDFDSAVDGNINDYFGEANIEGVYAGNIELTDHLTFGVTYFNVDTNVTSNFVLSKSASVHTIQNISNNSIFGHVLLEYKEHFFFDVGAAFGNNIISTNSVINTTISGYTNTENNNWFTQFASIYNNNWKQLTYTFNAGILYSEVDAGSYQFYYAAQNIAPVNVPSIRNRTIFVTEGLELGYKTENNGLTFTPFLNGGLVQIPVNNSTRKSSVPVVNGSLPQLSVNQNGYRAGTGVNLVHNKFTIRVEEVYYRAGNVFASYQTVANLKYIFD